MDSYFYIKSIKTKKDKIPIRTVTTFKGGTEQLQRNVNTA